MNHRRRPARSPTPPLPLNPVLERGGAYPLLRLDERRREVEERGIELYDFGTGDPREPTDPKIRRGLHHSLPEGGHKPTTPGKREQREALRAGGERSAGGTLGPTTAGLPAT